jgi:hypothetical protein
MWALKNLLIGTGIVASLTLTALLSWNACRRWLQQRADPQTARP